MDAITINLTTPPPEPITITTTEAKTGPIGPAGPVGPIGPVGPEAEVTTAKVTAAMATPMTIAAAKTFTGQVELTGQSEMNPTSAMTREMVLSELVFALGTVFRSHSWVYSHSGTNASSAAEQTNGYARASLSSGVADGGWARVVMARGLSSHVGYSGAGIHFNRHTKVALRFSGSINTGVMRVLVGATSAEAGYGSAVLAQKGYGVEVAMKNGAMAMRVVAHDGMGYAVSDWVELGIEVYSTWNYLSVSCKTGMVVAEFARKGVRPTVQVSLPGGPITVGLSTADYVTCSLLNPTPASGGNSVAVSDALFTCI